jgi:hypothetical protein
MRQLFDHIYRRSYLLAILASVSGCHTDRQDGS